MTSTALGANEAKDNIFISEAHEKFYYEKLKDVRLEGEIDVKSQIDGNEA